ncbi:MAG TPA: hypothetical protein VN887_01455 [Candidatus Angelobacter sp.]|nr:hypothetical protein [Candidatus Angelobacter sp.]
MLSSETLLAQANPLQQSGAGPPSGTESSQGAPDLLGLPLVRPTRNEISVSADYLFGQGTVTFPELFSLRNSGFALGSSPDVGIADRKSDYAGATISYSFNQAWYLDLSYARGHSSAAGPVVLLNVIGGPPSVLPTTFNIDDDWDQAYVRYTFPALRFTRFSAYLRAGVSFVQADLHAIDSRPSPLGGLYEQTDRTEDILGNAGFGLVYFVYRGYRAKLGLQLEGEGFYGHRSQDSREDLHSFDPYPIVNARIDNDLYGGLGRSTVRFEYALGRRGVFKLLADAGMEVKYTRIEYSDFDIGTRDELLWGPYAKIGLKYSF